MNMADLLYHQSSGLSDQSISALRSLLSDLKPPFGKKDSVGVKLHPGEKGNRSFLPPAFAREITRGFGRSVRNPLFSTRRSCIPEAGAPGKTA